MIYYLHKAPVSKVTNHFTGCDLAQFLVCRFRVVRIAQH